MLFPLSACFTELILIRITNSTFSFVSLGCMYCKCFLLFLGANGVSKFWNELVKDGEVVYFLFRRHSLLMD